MVADRRLNARRVEPLRARRADEVRVLKRFAKEIRRKLPVSPMVKLQRKLDRAVKNEKYEEAARLRDKIVALQNHPGAGGAKKEVS